MARVHAARDLVLDRPVARQGACRRPGRPGGSRTVRPRGPDVGRASRTPTPSPCTTPARPTARCTSSWSSSTDRSLADRLATDGPLPVAEAPADRRRRAGRARRGPRRRDRPPRRQAGQRPARCRTASSSWPTSGSPSGSTSWAPDLTTTGQFIGHARSTSPPSRSSASRPTPATDLYATGVVLYEMLAGRPPFDAGTPLATAIAHRDAPVPDVRATRPDVPTGLAAAVARAMAKDPGRPVRRRRRDARRAARCRSSRPRRRPRAALVPPTRVERTRLLPPARRRPRPVVDGARRSRSRRSPRSWPSSRSPSPGDDDDDDPASTTSPPAPASARQRRHRRRSRRHRRRRPPPPRRPPADVVHDDDRPLRRHRRRGRADRAVGGRPRAPSGRPVRRC